MEQKEKNELNLGTVLERHRQARSRKTGQNGQDLRAKKQEESHVEVLNLGSNRWRRGNL